MLDRRLFALVPAARPYIVLAVLFQWVALLCNIAFISGIGMVAGSIASVFLGVSGASALPFGIDATWAQAFLGNPACLCAACALVIACRACCLYVSQRFGHKASAVAKRTIRSKVYDKLVRIGPSYKERVSTSEAVQISVEGVEQMESYFGGYLPQFVYALLAPITLFACLAPLCLPAAIVLLVCVPLIPISIVAVMRRAKRTTGAYWDSYTDLGATFLENLQGLTTLKVYKADAVRHEQMNAEAEKFRQATMRLLRTQLSSVTTMDLFAYGGAALGIIFAVVQFLAGSTSFTSAFTIVFLAAEFFLPMRRLGSLFHTAMGSMAVAERIFKVLDAPEAPAASAVPDLSKEGIVCEGLSYSYDGQRVVLQDIDLEVSPESFIGIVGPSGSGKSTLAGILTGQNAAYLGQARIGGAQIREVGVSALASNVTVVTHSSHLFAGTLRSNLQIACPKASDAEMMEALKSCRIGSFVASSGGLDMRISEGGQNLSGGQRQRIAIARALLHDTPVYIFDEATSNIDAASESAIMEVVERLAKEKTVVMISHRLAALRKADRIYTLSEGRMVEAGSHDELVQAGGLYASMWEQQSELEAYAAPGNGEPGSFVAGTLRDDGADSEQRPGDSDISPRHCEQSEPKQGATFRHFEHSEADQGAAFRHSERSPKGGVEESPSTRKAVNTRRMGTLAVMLRLVKLVRPLAPYMVLAIALGVAGFLAAIFLMYFGIDSLLGGLSGEAPAIALLAATVVCGIARGPLHYGEQICNHFIAFKLLAHIRDLVFSALRRLAPAKLEGRKKGDLVSMLTSDIELLEVFYAHTISPVAIAVLVCIVLIVFMLHLHPAFSALAACAYIVVGAVLPFAASRAQGRRGRQARDAVGSMNAFVLDGLRGLRETLQYGCEAARAEEMDERMAQLAAIESFSKRAAAAFTATCDALIMLADVAFIALACSLVASSAISGFAAVLALALFMGSFGPVVAVANLGSSLSQTIASGERVLDLLDEQPVTREVTDGQDIEAFSGLEMQGVGFGYSGKRVLEGVDISVEPGSVVRIAGPSGAGKSTLLSLLMRFWDPDTGSVSASGIDLRQVNTDSLRDMESFMTQDTHLFTGTIAENIRIACQDATAEQLESACASAQLNSLIERLPKGLETPLGELGEGLSGGERQRIGLARAFLHDAPLMLLDEPTSNLDSLNEAEILRAIDRARAGRTVVIVSHRDTVARLVDRTYTVGSTRRAPTVP